VKVTGLKSFSDTVTLVEECTSLWDETQVDSCSPAQCHNFQIQLPMVCETCDGEIVSLPPSYEEKIMGGASIDARVIYTLSVVVVGKGLLGRQKTYVALCR
jgi:hypothetical protein